MRRRPPHYARLVRVHPRMLVGGRPFSPQLSSNARREKATPEAHDTNLSLSQLRVVDGRLSAE
jgi:hypothetical protein